MYNIRFVKLGTFLFLLNNFLTQKIKILILLFISPLP